MEEFKENCEYPTLAGLPVDICIFTVITDRLPQPADVVDKRSLKSYPAKWLEMVLVQRQGSPFQGKWALPGGFTDIEHESLDKAAIRELKEETNLKASVAGGDSANLDIHLEQLKAYYHPDRDPRGYIPTVAYVALVHERLLTDLQAGGDAMKASLFRVQADSHEGLRLISQDEATILTDDDLAFDHANIIRDALRFLENKMMTTTVAATLLPPEFTIAELHQVIRAVVPSFRVSTTNFARDLVKTKSRDGMLEEVRHIDGTPKKSNRYSARPAQLYKFNAAFEAHVSLYPRF
ncbi:NUDIX hydrolase [Alicyclobacillus ferrooxydans]|uniref:Nudix hydrolase domain-containing protein n=1 Tax=Alicyclobacillus ferrooxydans TaxID=471514 RepID=A0A0P9CR12_9BACL|nr:NUDIX domain-containing protein [Alicyclobacillus ferrooxydans]KPV41788.1 hypothetical protein AN477_20325 [Alicyclobacillus ferrooxydans]